ncbi:MgtC/SapB family protein [Yoonia litorea]|uniref:Protein MgtC n=1 Tax=Yoonia litorea TaxID=1123755 RepID=A0A1I6MZR8_9RHOB|nr:MgtC/SapB family protein [Yoonia litorea]SFS21193.1 putative Mg2+ transporter-C (MgtC) family protein [Yoonia litorea]
MNELLAPDALSWSTTMTRLAAATLLPLAIGLERFFREKPIDFRPYVVISVVSCALLIATQDLLTAQVTDGARIDPTRVMQGVITGIGFLGAGAMYREGDIVKGAGTAASVWSAGAIGLICGIGEIWLAVSITAVIVVLMLASAPFTDRWDNTDSE